MANLWRLKLCFLCQNRLYLNNRHYIVSLWQEAVLVAANRQTKVFKLLKVQPNTTGFSAVDDPVAVLLSGQIEKACMHSLSFLPLLVFLAAWCYVAAGNGDWHL